MVATLFKDTAVSPETHLGSTHESRMAFLKAHPPFNHNHYDYETFFDFSSEQGLFRDYNEVRNFLVGQDFIHALVAGLEEEAGAASSVVLHQIGVRWGIHDYAVFKTWCEKEFQRPLEQNNLMFLLETWWWPLVSQGWGRWEVDLSHGKQGYLMIHIYDSVIAATLGEVGKPVCHLYAGLFAGFFSSLVHKPMACTEIQCYSMGETFCKFVLGSEEHIRAAETWFNAGARAKEIEARLQAGERLTP